MADYIEGDRELFPPLQKLSNLTYLMTGNGQYLSLKGIDVVPE